MSGVSVADHLGIRLDEYDARIRTFIPDYEAMIEAGAAALRALPADRTRGSAHERAPRIVDLGTGTGALAAACARVCPQLSLTAIDADAGILDMARSRLEPLGLEPTFVHGSFMDVTVPACDAIVASFALHHIPDAGDRRRLLRNLHHVVAHGGLLVFVDCYPSADATMARLEQDAWRAHLRQSYAASEADALLAAWAKEDTYVPLPDELAMIRAAGFAPHVVWRRNAFAVIAARA
jgi:ubiquinone/menaquinone biosynthesis C-methylase UbiE